MNQTADYISALSIGSRVSEITRNPVDAVTAGGFSAFIMSLTGTVPTLVPKDNNRVQLVLSVSQIRAFQRFLDDQLSAVRKGKPGSLDIAIGPAIGPWAMKYAVPALIAVFLTGWFAHYYFGGQ